MNDRFDFDALAREVAGGFSRREALRRLGFGLTAGLVAELTGWLPAWPTSRAAAAPVAPSASLCFPEIVTKGSLTSWLTVSSTLESTVLKPSACSGCAAESCCNGVCVGLDSDPKNCGACGRACGLGQSCENGICVCVSDAACVFPAPNGRTLLQTCCHGSCTDLQADPSNCGSCGHVCPSGTTCSTGKCGQLTTCPRPDLHPCGLVCCENTQMCCPGRVNAPCCEPGLICCGSVCTDLLSDASNCGSCDHPCNPGLGCSNGRCCSPGLTGCPSGCFNVANDVNNCGTCGNRCFPAEICLDGHCSCGNLGVGCSSDQTCCNGRCCNAGQTCCNGQCCNAGQTCCNGQCASSQSDPNNCGACANTCSGPVNGNGTRACANGVCGIVCNSGFANCLVPITINGVTDHMAPGCVDLQSDDLHCGGCGNDCTNNIFDHRCCSGTCTNVELDSHNCGECGHVCGSTLGIRHPCICGNCVGG